MNKAVFLDRDGTINIDKGYVYKEEDCVITDETVSCLKKLYDAGYALIIITNQSGIARGYFSEKEFIEFNKWMLDYLKKRGVIVSKVYYCPHLPNAQIKEYDKICDCRKPNIALYERAIDDFVLDVSKCFAIGDKVTDLNICKMTDCRGFLISDTKNNKVNDEIVNVGSLAEAVSIILSYEEPR